MKSANPKSKPVIIIARVITGLGLLFALVGAYLIVGATQFSRNAVATTGLVVAIELVRDIDSDTGSDTISFRPTFEYSDIDGNLHTSQTAAASTMYDYEIGEEVEIMFSPDNPDAVRVSGFWSLYLLPSIFLVVGAGLIGLGLLISRVLRGSGTDQGIEMSGLD
ncbi:DUF3592 domain-containing protein [Jannaschia seohaensis]|uniref:Uncharacterized protein DUF3592 n=1 Tax=Jannaschia seohaensis TaxID=475081 RepID=A0A2Y9B5U1_9RHOB|nr:DUF3592 domain-containing protein [Jannaschia seohaensis]PWJ09792.1 uncharacterized protein DUF3592 [Jannaschia seohaensis]SSA51946.1 Protein of unknown function [Jannaschia seohaensis]